MYTSVENKTPTKEQKQAISFILLVILITLALLAICSFLSCTNEGKNINYNQLKSSDTIFLPINQKLVTTYTYQEFFNGYMTKNMNSNDTPTTYFMSIKNRNKDYVIIETKK